MREKPEKKIPFLNVCATVGFTPSGLACMAQVSPWVVYAMLDQQVVTRKQAEKVLATLTELGPGAVYSLANVDVVFSEEKVENVADAEQTHYSDRSE